MMVEVLQCLPIATNLVRAVPTVRSLAEEMEESSRETTSCSVAKSLLQGVQVVQTMLGLEDEPLHVGRKDTHGPFKSFHDTFFGARLFQIASAWGGPGRGLVCSCTFDGLKSIESFTAMILKRSQSSRINVITQKSTVNGSTDLWCQLMQTPPVFFASSKNSPKDVTRVSLAFKSLIRTRVTKSDVAISAFLISNDNVDPPTDFRQQLFESLALNFHSFG